MPSIDLEIERRPGDLALTDVERLVPAIPVLIHRLRGLVFDPDGVVRLDEGRREGLRLLAGVPGIVGARYRLVTRSEPPTSPVDLRKSTDDVAPDPVDLRKSTEGAGSEGVDPRGSTEETLDLPVELEVLRDDEQRLEIAVIGVVGTQQPVVLVVDRPSVPAGIIVTGDIEVAELPAVLGGRVIDALLEIRLAGLGAAVEPQCRVELALGRVSGHGTLHLLPALSGAGPGRVRLHLDVRLRGLLGPLTLLWPIVRRRVIEAARTEMISALAEIDDDLRDFLAGGADPDLLADQAMVALAETLAERVPNPI